MSTGTDIPKYTKTWGEISVGARIADVRGRWHHIVSETIEDRYGKTFISRRCVPVDKPYTVDDEFHIAGYGDELCGWLTAIDVTPDAETSPTSRGLGCDP